MVEQEAQEGKRNINRERKIKKQMNHGADHPILFYLVYIMILKKMTKTKGAMRKIFKI